MYKQFSLVHRCSYIKITYAAHCNHPRDSNFKVIERHPKFYVIYVRGYKYKVKRLQLANVIKETTKPDEKKPDTLEEKTTHSDRRVRFPDFYSYGLARGNIYGA